MKAGLRILKLHIAVCDDEKTESEYLSRLADEWATNRKIKAAISAFDSAEAFLFAYDADKSFDLLLLDIQMKRIDGVTLAKRIRASGGKMQIIFVTGLPDHIAEGYEVSALHYLMKPVDPAKLREVLDKAVETAGTRAPPIIVDTSDGPARVFPEDIRYAEAFAHTTEICVAGGTSYEGRLSIGDFESLLGDGFCRTHRSYVVGIGHVRQITKTDVILDDGKPIPLSRRRYDAVNRAFISFYRGNA
jgi:DNA-binding LytR/AlgR family response regulator